MSCPAHAEANTYVNRHNKLSSTLQCVCGPDKKFLHAFAGKLSFSSLISFVGFTVSFHLQVVPVKSMILQFSATRTYRGNCLQSVVTSSICLATQRTLFLLGFSLRSSTLETLHVTSSDSTTLSVQQEALLKMHLLY